MHFSARHKGSRTPRDPLSGMETLAQSEKYQKHKVFPEHLLLPAAAHLFHRDTSGLHHNATHIFQSKKEITQSLNVREKHTAISQS